MNPEQVLERYAKVAPRYDRVVNLWARLTFYPLERYRRQAVEELNLHPGDTALEIAAVPA